jgi:hypothetical protein
MEEIEKGIVIHGKNKKNPKCDRSNKFIIEFQPMVVDIIFYGVGKLTDNK